ncbi:MAG: glycosyltransferase family 2 protein [Thermodesulfobium sp.]
MLVSVVVFAYNRKSFILDALNSVVSQSADKSCIEIILIKNFEDAKIDEFCKANNIKAIHFDGTVGQYIARGIEESNGDIISFLDDDDQFCSNKIERLIEIYNSTQFDFLHNNYNEIDWKGDNRDLYMRKLHFTHYDFNMIVLDNIKNATSLKELIKVESDFNISCMSISANLAKEIHNIIKNVTACQDGFLFYFAIEYGKVIALGEKLTLYRVHESTSNVISDYSQFRKNACKDLKNQTQSLMLLLSSMSHNVSKRSLGEFIALKQLKLKSLRCDGISIKPKKLIALLFSKSRFNLYTLIWLSLYILSTLFGTIVGRAIFRYTRSIFD